MKMKEQPRVQKPRPSASAGASRKAELERLARMTVEERVLAALSLRDRMGNLRPSPLSR